MQSAKTAAVSLDVLSPLVQAAMTMGSGRAYTRLVAQGPGLAEAEALLRGLSPEQLLNKPVTQRPQAEAMLAGLWLWHDWLEPAHRLAQQIADSSGSFWHAIVHRRGGDFDNSRYWYARCADHPAMQALSVQAADIVNPMLADTSLLRLVWNGWNPAAWVDLVQQVHGQPDDARHAAAVRLQQLEWRILFDHCTRQAIG